MTAPGLDLSEAGARALDAGDVLRGHREAFALPRDLQGQPLVYFCGHSLGLMPRRARGLVEEELHDWERLGVLGHERATRDWVGYAERLRDDLAMLTGAQASEVVAMNSLTVNLHLLLASFFRPSGKRRRILIEKGAFSSDRHVVTSQLRWHGLDPSEALIEVAADDGGDLLPAAAIESAIAAAGDTLALVLWPGVQFRTGQCFDLARLAALTHDAGAVLVADLAHAIGNVPLALRSWQVDAAAWCGYKYLNGGPGAIGGCFIHSRHSDSATIPRLEGWWGHQAATRFQMPADFAPAPGAAAWQLSNPPILSTAPLLASLAEFRAAGLSALRAKSLRLTAYLRALLRARCAGQLTVITGEADAEHGAQLSIRIAGEPKHARRVFELLEPAGLIADWREPDIIRLAPAPLYNSFHDAWRAADILQACLRAA